MVSQCYACQLENEVKMDDRNIDVLSAFFKHIEDEKNSKIVWVTLLEASKILGISKDLIKYHKNKINPEYVVKRNGTFYISELGVEEIRTRLRKTEYANPFEGAVMNRLVEIELQLGHIIRTLEQMKNDH